MSNFTPLVNETYEFEGDTVVVSFARLKRKDMLNAMPALRNMDAATKAEDAKAQELAINDVLNILADVLPGYVRKFEGLNDSEGNPIAVETVCEDFYFTKLAAQMCMGLLSASQAIVGND